MSAPTLDELNRWDEPLPLGWHVKAPPFPAGVFPLAVGQYVEALAEATQTPLDLPGTVALGMLAAAVGGRIDVQCPAWIEPTNLFAVPVLPPASRKSGVVAACRAPLAEAEKQLREAIGDQVHDSQTAWEVLHKRAEAAKNTAARTGDEDDMLDAQEAVRRAERAREQIIGWPRLLASDATPEAMVGLLAEQGGRIAAVSAEAGVFASLTGRYGKAPNLDPVLNSHAGDAITVDRRSRSPELIERPALTIVASIQPFALREMVDRPDFAGRGLLARVLWSVPVDNAGYRRVRDVAPVPDAVQAAFRTLLVDLATWAGTTRTPTLVKLDDDATEVLLSYAERVERMLRPSGALGEYRLTKEWGGKLVGAVARIAGCLHAGRGLPGLSDAINADTMRNAVRLGEYFRAHAALALAPSDDKRTETGRTLLGWLVEKEKTTFTMRELCRSAPRALRSATVLDQHLTYLAELGWVRRKTDGAGYELHPDAARHLTRGDSGDNGDTLKEDAVQTTYGTPAEGVAAPGDNRRQSVRPGEQVSPLVAATGDAFQEVTPPILSSENAPPVAVVAAVAGQRRSSKAPTSGVACPECGQGLSAGDWQPCVKCGAMTHRYGPKNHGPYCPDCRPAS